MAAAPAPQRIPRRAPSPAPAGTARPQLRLVDPDARRRERRRRWLARVWAVGIVAAALLGVMVHAFMAEAQMQVGEVDKQMQTEQHRYEESRLRVAALSSPATIVNRAIRLGFLTATATRPLLVDAAGGGSVATQGATTPWQDAKRALDDQP